MARILKKAQDGKGLRKFTDKDYKRKDSVPSEMFPGKMIPKSKSNYETGRMAKGMKPAPKKKMKDGGKAFPDLNKDGKVTKADILVGRGVIKAKKGITMKKSVKMKKAADGTSASPTVYLRSGQLKRLGRLSAKKPGKAKRKFSKMVERATREERGAEYLKKNVGKVMPSVPTLKKGGSLKKARNGATLAPTKKSTSTNLASYKRVIGKSMRNGGKMKSCRGGCY